MRNLRLIGECVLVALSVVFVGCSNPAEPKCNAPRPLVNTSTVQWCDGIVPCVNTARNMCVTIVVNH